MTKQLRAKIEKVISAWSDIFNNKETSTDRKEFIDDLVSTFNQELDKEKKQACKIGEHRKDCVSVRCVKEGTWNSSWVVPELRWLRTPGKRGRPTTSPHIVFKCNDPRCEAKLAVVEKDILKLLPTT